MGASNKLTMPAYKTLLAGLEEAAPNCEILALAAKGKPRLNIPAGVISTLKGYPKLMTWAEKNRVAIEKFATATSERAKGAAG